MNDENAKPVVLWILQDNQLSPIIFEFLSLLKKGLGNMDLQILVPESDTSILETTKPLNPIPFKARKLNSPSSLENFQKKKDLIHDLEFSEGLKAWRTLILDDFGEGILSETALHCPPIKYVKLIILQIPTPLGSATQEEFIFYAWINLAKKNNVPIAGYELLPLNTRWTLLPSLLDAIITTNEKSFDHLSRKKHHIPGKIWTLPRYEGKVFSPGSSHLWTNGLQSVYHYRIGHKIPQEKTILFIPHNVAMSYEYRRLLEEIKEFANDIHLMFCIGKDQIRGTHSHQEIIETISHKTINSFYSYSFHDLVSPWEMILADAVLACATCYSTLVAEANGIPCIVMDSEISPAADGYLTIVNTYDDMRTNLKKIMATHNKQTDIVNILTDLVSGKIKKITND